MRDNETDRATDARVPLQRQRAFVHAHSGDTKGKFDREVWKPTSLHLLRLLFDWDGTEYQWQSIARVYGTGEGCASVKMETQWPSMGL